MTDNEITYEIRGAIFDVYNELGPGLLESVYEEALAFEILKRGLTIERQLEVPIIYKGNTLKSPLRIDILVEKKSYRRIKIGRRNEGCILETNAHLSKTYESTCGPLGKFLIELHKG